MGFLDNLFSAGSDTQKSTTTSKLPDWVNSAAKNNYATAVNIASRPYVPYSAQRLAGFNADQNNAMGMLRNYAPTALANSGKFEVPRIIDNIGADGTIEKYMTPYIENVLNRTQTRIRQATDMAQQANNMNEHQSGAFGDARHGIASGQIEEKGIQQMGDAAADGYAAAFDNAMGLRQYDINNLFGADQASQAHQQQFLQYLDSLYRSGSNQQALDQNSLELAYQDFLRQLNYPVEQYNLLVAGLNSSPYETTSVNKTKVDTPSTAAQILGTIGNIASVF